MKYETEIRELLISNTIHLIAEGGFEKATTKELTHCGGDLPNMKMNEAYLYRIFGSKENLYDEAFVRLDRELCYAFRHGAETVGGFLPNSRERLYSFFLLAWRFVLGNEERCRCYVRYYYSIYFKGHSLEAHKRLFSGILSEMAPLFKDEADVPAILHSVFTTMLDFGIRVYNGDLEDSDINIPHIFNVLYCMMSTYFKE
jgi:AcrR family transcriptional regulator